MTKYLLMWLVRPGVYEIQRAYTDTGYELEDALLFDTTNELWQFVDGVCDDTPYTKGVDVFAVPIHVETKNQIQHGNHIPA